MFKVIITTQHHSIGEASGAIIAALEDKANQIVARYESQGIHPDRLPASTKRTLQIIDEAQALLRGELQSGEVYHVTVAGETYTLDLRSTDA